MFWKEVAYSGTYTANLFSKFERTLIYSANPTVPNMCHTSSELAMADIKSRRGFALIVVNFSCMKRWYIFTSSGTLGMVLNVCVSVRFHSCYDVSKEKRYPRVDHLGSVNRSHLLS